MEKVSPPIYSSDFVKFFADMNNINLAPFVNLRSFGLDYRIIRPPPATVWLFTF
jgi:hypothetical protein